MTAQTIEGEGLIDIDENVDGVSQLLRANLSIMYSCEVSASLTDQECELDSKQEKYLKEEQPPVIIINPFEKESGGQGVPMVLGQVDVSITDKSEPLNETFTSIISERHQLL